MKRRTSLAVIVAAVAAFSHACWAQEWPNKAVKVIVPFAAGSSPDIVARLVADVLRQENKGQPFIVENKAGAGGNIGTETIAKSPADGYTIGVSIGGPLAINTMLVKDLRYVPSRDIAPISILVSQPSVLAVHSSVPAKTVAELIALMKKEPGKLNYGSIGNGSLSHLGMEAVAHKAGAAITHVPYPGSPAAVTALLRNDVQVAMLPASSLVAQAGSGQYRMLAVSTANRAPTLPDLPTLVESGIDVDADAWIGLIAPAGTPQPILDALQRSAAKAMQDPGIREKLTLQHIVAVGSPSQTLKDRMASEITRWKPIIEAAKIEAN